MKEIGKILKAKREERKLDFEGVRKGTKVQEKYLEAIENGDKNVFTAEVYYKSFVRSYANFLGLNADELIQSYNVRKAEKEAKEQAIQEKDDKIKRPLTNKNEKGQNKEKSISKDSFDTKKIAITIIIAVFLVVAFIYLNKNINNIVEDNTKVVYSQEKKNTSNALQAVPDETSSVSNIPQQASILNKQILEVEAIDNVWIKVDADKKEIFEGTILKGRKKSWQADEVFTLRIGYTPGIKIFFNNNPVDVNSGAVQDVNTITLRKQ